MWVGGLEKDTVSTVTCRRNLAVKGEGETGEQVQKTERKQSRSFYVCRVSNITFHIFTPHPLTLHPQGKRQESIYRHKETIYMRRKETEDAGEQRKITRGIKMRWDSWNNAKSR